LDTAKEISRIRNTRIPFKRISKRDEYERKAKSLLLEKIASLSWDVIDSVISLIDSDFWDREKIEGRFFPLFSKPNRNRIRTNTIRQLRRFLCTIIEDEDIGKIDDVISDLNGISYGAASLFFYIKDNNRFNVFLPATVKGLKTIYSEGAKDLIYARPFEKNYSLFNKLCASLKKEYSLKPQELDIILTVFGKEVETREIEILDSIKIPEEVEISDHVKAEAILLEIGKLLGFDTYTADPSKVFEGKNLGELASIQAVPKVLQSTKNIEKIDVIWHNEGSPPSYLFEIEHGGTMRDALHRLYQARHFNARFFVIGPKENFEKFEEWLSTAPYNSSRKLYSFRTFEDLSRLYSLIKNTEDFKKKFGIL